MTTLCLTIAEINKLNPCGGDWLRVRRLLRAFNPNVSHCFTAAEAVEAGCTLDDIFWVASRAAQADSDVASRFRHWMADCATHVLHIYEKQHPGDPRVRDAIKAAHDFADGKINADELAASENAARNAAWDVAQDAADATSQDGPRGTGAVAAPLVARNAIARAAARASARASDVAVWNTAWHAAREAEEKWQLARLLKWLSDTPPNPLRLPKIPKEQTND